jgi:hypothetical protein
MVLVLGRHLIRSAEEGWHDRVNHDSLAKLHFSVYKARLFLVELDQARASLSLDLFLTVSPSSTFLSRIPKLDSLESSTFLWRLS